MKKIEKIKKKDELEKCKFCSFIGRNKVCVHMGNTDIVHAPHNRLKRKRCEERFCPLKIKLEK